MSNPVLCWDSSGKWVQAVKEDVKIWVPDGSEYQWSSVEGNKVFDGHDWVDELSGFVVYPSLISYHAELGEGTLRNVRLPWYRRLGDLIVSVCVADSDGDLFLEEPVNRQVVTYRLPQSGARAALTMFHFDGLSDLYDGYGVCWRVSGGGPSAVVNYCYRGAKTDEPIFEPHRGDLRLGLSEAPLKLEPENVTLFVVITRSRGVRLVEFPKGVNTHRPFESDPSGDVHWRINSADMAFDDSVVSRDIGNVNFGMIQPEALVITYKIPGGVKGKVPDYLPDVNPPVGPDVPGGGGEPEPDPLPPAVKCWILGDTTDSVLGRTTVLKPTPLPPSKNRWILGSPVDSILGKTTIIK